MWRLSPLGPVPEPEPVPPPPATPGAPRLTVHWSWAICGPNEWSPASWDGRKWPGPRRHWVGGMMPREVLPAASVRLLVAPSPQSPGHGHIPSQSAFQALCQTSRSSGSRSRCCLSLSAQERGHLEDSVRCYRGHPSGSREHGFHTNRSPLHHGWRPRTLNQPCCDWPLWTRRLGVGAEGGTREGPWAVSQVRGSGRPLEGPGTRPYLPEIKVTLLPFFPSLCL